MSVQQQTVVIRFIFIYSFRFSRDNNGRTILHLTAANGSVHLVDALLKVDG